jgi:hypothetical protein
MTIRDITKKLRSIQFIYTDGRVGGCVSFANARIWVCAIKYQYIQYIKSNTFFTFSVV